MVYEIVKVNNDLKLVQKCIIQAIRKAQKDNNIIYPEYKMNSLEIAIEY